VQADEVQRALDDEKRQNASQSQRAKLLTAQLSAMTSQRDKHAAAAEGLQKQIRDVVEARMAADEKCETMQVR
jgi:hypothetical protein